MTPAISSRRSKKEIADALKAQIAATKLDDEVTPAFERVEIFDVESLTEAFQLLLISEQRCCVIVILDETFTTEIEGRSILVTREQPVAILMSDRILGDRVKALWGDADDASAPGAFALAEIVLPAVTGQLISCESGKSGVIAQPQNLSSIFLTEEDRQELPGRAAVSLELVCRGGTLEASTDPGPTL